MDCWESLDCFYKTKLSKEQKELLSIVGDSGESLLHIVNDTLIFLR